MDIEKLANYEPCPDEVIKYKRKLESNIEGMSIENSLHKLFTQQYPNNERIEDVLIKCAALNEFYSTNIFKIYNVARHYVSVHIDERLEKKDIDLVDDLAVVPVNGGVKHFYSFATKYCSFHQPDYYPIFDSYIYRLLTYFKKHNKKFCFKSSDVYSKYGAFKDAIDNFIKAYHLQDFSYKDIDIYLWQLGKEVF